MILNVGQLKSLTSLPARGAWVEIPLSLYRSYPNGGRSPHGERGLKSIDKRPQKAPARSLPARGAWVEMYLLSNMSLKLLCRSPHGERGLKLRKIAKRVHGVGRSPHGERGLKSYTSTGYVKREWSLPARGAWVEMGRTLVRCHAAGVAPRTGSVG